MDLTKKVFIWKLISYIFFQLLRHFLNMLFGIYSLPNGHCAFYKKYFYKHIYRLKHQKSRNLRQFLHFRLTGEQFGFIFCVHCHRHITHYCSGGPEGGSWEQCYDFSQRVIWSNIETEFWYVPVEKGAFILVWYLR